jgi:hypothetical protein
MGSCTGCTVCAVEFELSHAEVEFCKSCESDNRLRINYQLHLLKRDQAALRTVRPAS